MTISQSTLKEFAKAVAPPKQKSEGTMVTGTAKEYDGGIYVQIDGSEQLTPIASSTAGIKDGDRITVMVKDHKVTATGNVSMPSTNQGDLDDLHSDISGEFNNKIGEFEEVIASKATIEELEAQTARIDTLTADNVTIKETLTAETARINNLEANKANIEDLEAMNAHISNLEADMLTAEVADITYAKIDDLEAVSGDFYTLQADYADFKTVTADDISANTAKIEHLESTMITTDNLDAKYAKIDFANIGEAAIEKLFSESGIIGDLVMSDGHVTGTLVGVTIKGDLIEGGTVVADKLVIKGEDGLFYKLNTDGVDISAEQTEYNSLNGSVITAKSITAEKVNVDDLVAFGATIGGFNIDTDSLYSGVKSSVNNTTSGVYMDDTGQFALGNATDYLKFYKDGSNWKLDISASSIKFGSSSTSLEQTITNIQNAAEAAEEAASNANSNASDAAEKADQLEQSLNDYKDVVAGSYATKAELENSGNSILATVEENYQIKGDYVTDEESALVLEADGGIIDCGDTAGMPLAGLTVYGQTRQNLWASFNGSKYGITYKTNGDGSISISGTSTGTGGTVVAQYGVYVLRPGGTYTLSIDKPLPENCWIGVADVYGGSWHGYRKIDGGSGNTSVTFTTSSQNERVDLAFQVTEANVTVSGTYRVMLNEGSEAQPWCPPGLNSVEELSVVTAGKNLAPTLSVGTSVGYTATVNKDGSYKISGTSTRAYESPLGISRVTLVPGEKYYINGSIEGSIDKFYAQITEDFYGKLRYYVNRSFTAKEGAIYALSATTAKANNAINGNLYIQLELGSTATAYEPPAVTSTPIDLLGNKISSLPDGTRDELTVDVGGNVVLRKKTHQQVIVGDDLLYRYVSNTVWITLFNNPILDYEHPYDASLSIEDNAAFSDKIPYYPIGNTGALPVFYSSRIGISTTSQNAPQAVYVNTPLNTTVAEAKEWLNDNPVQFLYALKDPYDIPLGTVDLPDLPETNAHVWISTGTQGLDPDIHATWYGENASALKDFASKAELKVESDQIKATVEETYSTKGEVSAVEDKANAAQDALDSYKETVSTTYATKSSVTQTANSIKQEVSETYTTKTEFEGLEVGGRNLLYDTKDMTVKKVGGNAQRYYTTYGNSVGTGGGLVRTSDGIKLTFGSYVHVSIQAPLASFGNVENGETVTLSFTYRGNITRFGDWCFLQQTLPNVSVWGFPGLNADGQWHEYKHTFSSPDANVRTCVSVLMFYGLRDYDKTKWVEIKEGTLKLERGNKATDWTPAPEDMLSTADASATYATKTSLSTVEQTVNGLKSTVSSNYTTLNNKFGNYYTKTEVDQKDNSIKSTVSSVQTTANNALEKATEVEQTADGLSVRVTQAEKDVDTAQSTADTAKTNAATAQSTANTANSTANAAKTAAANAQSKADSAYSKATTLEVTVDGIEGRVQDAEGNISSLEQTSSGLEVRLTQAEKDVDTAQSTANTAKSTASTANTTANAAKTAATNAQTAANNAAKTATNYLKFDSSGLCVGNMTGTLGYNTLIKSEGMDIRNGTTVLASFTSSQIDLGKNSRSTTINMANSGVIISANSSSASLESGIGGSLVIGGDWTAITVGRRTINLSAGLSDGGVYVNGWAVQPFIGITDWTYLYGSLESGREFVRVRKMGSYLVVMQWDFPQNTATYWELPNLLPSSMRPSKSVYAAAARKDSGHYLTNNTAYAFVSDSGAVGFQCGNSQSGYNAGCVAWFTG